MRGLRIVINWIGIITMPVWGGFANWYFIAKYLINGNDEDIKSWLKGETWIFKD